MQYETLGAGYIIKDTVYGSKVDLYVYTSVDETQKYIEKMCDVTNARAVCEVLSNEYIDL